MARYSPLRYPGGKGKLIAYFKQIIKDNGLLDGVYVEPYAGGASVALALLIDGYVSRVVINDIDRSIYAFWHSVLNETDELCNLIEKTPVTVKNWRIQKEKQGRKNECGLLELGFSTFFLNRTNRSGILSAGVIGGLKQEGQWKINARYNKEALIKRIKKIASYKDQIELHNQDAMDLIKTLSRVLPEKTLIYFDPPYYVKGNKLYLNHYVPEDHKEIFSKIRRLKLPYWIVTYDNVLPIQKLYAPFRQEEYKLGYSVAKYNVGREIMIFSDALSIKTSPNWGEGGGQSLTFSR
ncbi:DNA adenine methylase [Candidatus Micrarchaeota archaeon]|nr:DNA adenine methylase [Candidatus Micrarchaeota archaeon]